MGSLDRSSEGGREVGHGIYFLGFPREYLDHTVTENLNNVNLVQSLEHGSSEQNFF